MPLHQVFGWTVVTPSTDSRIVYIAVDGDDAAAALVKGRGYYLPNDPDIGSDPTQPVGAVVAYRNPQEALKVLRGTGAAPGGAPEWVLFRRGDTFPNSIMNANYCYWSGGPSFTGIWTWAWGTNLQRNSSCGEPRWGSAFSYVANGGGGNFRGRSESEPFVISAWGNPSDPRPIFPNKFGIAANMWNSVISSLDMQGGIEVGNAGSGAWTNTLVEDCFILAGVGGFHISGGSPSTKFTMRRCVITGSFNPTGHNSAPFVGLVGGASLLFDECIFDHNGFKENPFDPSKWTAGSVSNLSAGQFPMGEGVQPTRTFYDRNIYVGTGDGVNHVRFAIRGSIISRGGGGGTVQMRQGGISERNVFMWNEDVGSMLCGPGGIFSKNLVLHDDHMRPPGGWGLGLNVNNSETWNNEGKGWSLDADPRYIVEDSVFAHFHRGSNGGGILDISNTSTRHHANGSNLGTILNGRVKVINNAIYRSQSSGMRFASYGTWDDAIFGGNEIAIANGTLFNSEVIHLSSVPEKGSLPYSIGNSSSGGNLYWSQSANPFGNRTFSQWKALRSEFETESQFLSDFDSFKSIAGWTTPERDIVSYMQSIDPNYIPNEDVTTDDGVPANKRRPNARLVREVLRDPSLGGYTAQHWGDSEGMTEARARLISRRYHAFITFMENAKSNRKGEWDPNYTADALNNHIREGFGKEKISGEYDNRDINTRTMEYFDQNGLIDSLVVVAQPIGNISGQTLSVQPKIALRNSSNMTIFSDSSTEINVTVHSGSNGTLGGTTKVKSINGMASFTDLSLSGIVGESYVLRFSVSTSDIFVDSIGVFVINLPNPEEPEKEGPSGPTSSSEGFQGSQGHIGFQGSQGHIGSQGSQGHTGFQGSQGHTGFQGIQGQVGAEGTQGPIGPQGPQGIVVINDYSLPSFVLGSNFGTIERILFNREYLVEMSVPSERRIVGIVGETLQGTCILEVYRNSDLIERLEVSPKRSSIQVFKNNLVLEGDDIQIKLVQSNRLRVVREVKYSIHYEQAIKKH